MPLLADSPVQYIPGIGPARAAALGTLGLNTVGDLLNYFPFRYESQQGETQIEDVRPGMTGVSVRGEIVRLSGLHRASTYCDIHDGTGTLRLRWFQGPFQALHRGETVVASGDVREYNHELEMIQPRITVFQPGTVTFAGSRGGMSGVYRGNAQVKSPLIARASASILRQAHLPVDESLPESLRRERGLVGIQTALRGMHLPRNEADLEAARRRLAYEELFLMELAMALRRRKRLALQVGVKLQVTHEIDQRIRARFPFALTASQNKVVSEIATDLQSGRPMTRLVQGDVGSGKTVVALYACLAAIAGRRQAAIMAPTEILAQQHYRNIELYLEGSRVRRMLLRGGQPAAARDAALRQIERGEIDLVVGTQALIQRDVAFHQLALVVVDEQHKFGVLQRHQFRTKGPMPHYLVMTATPIPRTLAMTVFGDLDVSVIQQSPPGRGKIITKVVRRGQWETVMNYVRKRLEAGEQAYVVCPVIGSDEKSESREHGSGDESGPRDRGIKGSRTTESAIRNRQSAINPQSEIRDSQSKRGLVSVIKAHQRLIDGPWHGLEVGLLHGSLNSASKQRAIERFASGELRAIVATTVVEVGVDVPNATIMVVENADRYGLSQLHQLRGRVGRGMKDSLCVLVAAQDTEKSRERLAVLTETTDGFKIAEADLRLRGPGQLFGTKQHGLPELRIASIIDDFALLDVARQDAFELVARDPDLMHAESRLLQPALRKMFGEKLKLIDAA